MGFIGGLFNYLKTHKKLTAVLLIIIIVLVIIFRPKPPVLPDTQKITRGDIIQSVSVSGTVNAKKQADLSFISSGVVTYLGANKGDLVKAGQVIAVVDQRTILKNLQNALTVYSEQRNAYDQNIDNTQGRTQPEQALNDAMKRIIQNNQYDLQKAVVSVELQDLARQQSVLISPIDGVLVRSDAQTTGSSVTSAAVFSVIDPNSLVFSMDVDEADIAKIQEGFTTNVNLDSYQDKILTLPVSHIDFVSHTTTNGGNAFTVEVKLPFNSSNKYRVGMQGNADIILAKKTNVLTAPLTSVADGNFVYIQNNNKFKKVHVTTGIQDNINIEIKTGIKENDKIVIDPTQIPKEYL